jgi:hypothetical protein
MSWKETDTPFKLFLAFYTKIGICKVRPLRAFTRVFFFLLSQTGFVWLPCVCVILFFQSGISVIVWDFPEWRRLGFTEFSTFLLFTHGKGSLAFEGNIEQFEFQILHFYLCIHFNVLWISDFFWFIQQKYLNYRTWITTASWVTYCPHPFLPYDPMRMASMLGVSTVYVILNNKNIDE